MTTDSKRTHISGHAIVVRGADIDTDRIIPARFLRTVTFEGLGAHAFEDERAQGDHPFDQERFQGASILVANQNFGCGSSREHAPQALTRWGIKAFVAESFAEIFFGNCLALGLPCLTASGGDVSALMDSIDDDPRQEIAIDLAAQTVVYKGGQAGGSIPDGPREQFLHGTWDALGQLLEAGTAIDDTAAKLPYVSAFK
jgi:3-isopropylmalate/(R)-2-methylmalate dehydratase small subunit